MTIHERINSEEGFYRNLRARMELLRLAYELRTYAGRELDIVHEPPTKEPQWDHPAMKRWETCASLVQEAHEALDTFLPDGD